ncbi:hypothetical protein SS50377_24955 [Spironucleus salmonicida]|uniref:Uncharacterized protein n=1 Tax=Spironucleus salmonicida TaxID=348837 RepID=V6LIE2_9EUKA|nr:hypothetical protein SS50377_24955 [Spironucleus salmonicida]|eukprot:EST43481.1 Hypothetical protein SS50377_16851 [Spironucleus salmonicida]
MKPILTPSILAHLKDLLLKKLPIDPIQLRITTYDSVSPPELVSQLIGLQNTSNHLEKQSYGAFKLEIKPEPKTSPFTAKINALKSKNFSPVAKISASRQNEFLMQKMTQQMKNYADIKLKLDQDVLTEAKICEIENDKLEISNIEIQQYDKSTFSPSTKNQLLQKLNAQKLQQQHKLDLLKQKEVENQNQIQLQQQNIEIITNLPVSKIDSARQFSLAQLAENSDFSSQNFCDSPGKRSEISAPKTKISLLESENLALSDRLKRSEKELLDFTKAKILDDSEGKRSEIQLVFEVQELRNENERLKEWEKERKIGVENQFEFAFENQKHEIARTGDLKIDNLEGQKPEIEKEAESQNQIEIENNVKSQKDAQNGSKTASANQSGLSAQQIAHQGVKTHELAENDIQSNSQIQFNKSNNINIIHQNSQIATEKTVEISSPGKLDAKSKFSNHNIIHQIEINPTEKTDSTAIKFDKSTNSPVIIQNQQQILSNSNSNFHSSPPSIKFLTHKIKILETELAQKIDQIDAFDEQVSELNHQLTEKQTIIDLLQRVKSRGNPDSPSEILTLQAQIQQLKTEKNAAYETIRAQENELQTQDLNVISVDSENLQVKDLLVQNEILANSLLRLREKYSNLQIRSGKIYIQGDNENFSEQKPVCGSQMIQNSNFAGQVYPQKYEGEIAHQVCQKSEQKAVNFSLSPQSKYANQSKSTQYQFIPNFSAQEHQMQSISAYQHNFSVENATLRSVTKFTTSFTQTLPISISNSNQISTPIQVSHLTKKPDLRPQIAPPNSTIFRFLRSSLAQISPENARNFASSLRVLFGQLKILIVDNENQEWNYVFEIKLRNALKNVQFSHKISRDGNLRFKQFVSDDGVDGSNVFKLMCYLLLLRAKSVEWEGRTLFPRVEIGAEIGSGREGENDIFEGI